jgi:hypothetical protein
MSVQQITLPGGIPMDASKESLVGGMPGGMMDNMMCSNNPLEILNRLIQSETMEAPIYNQLIQTAPNACLRMMFQHLCDENAEQVRKLQALVPEFRPGTPHPGTGKGSGPDWMNNPNFGPPLFFNEEQQDTKKE